MTGLLPTSDALTAPFFEAAGQGRLALQRCTACGALRWPPLAGCPDCRSRETAWVDVVPAGTIWSYVVYHRAFAPELKSEIPYTVAMVELDAGPYMVGRIIEGEQPPTVGARVAAVFVQTDGGPSVRWEIV